MRTTKNSAFGEALKKPFQKQNDESNEADNNKNGDARNPKKNSLYQSKALKDNQKRISNPKNKGRKNTIRIKGKGNTGKDKPKSFRKKNKKAKRTGNGPHRRIRYGAPTLEPGQISSIYGGRGSAKKIAESLQTRDLRNSPTLRLQDGFSGVTVSDVFCPGEVRRPELTLLDNRNAWPQVALAARLANPQVLRLGLDMGTSATKVVVLDPARALTAWAIPFSEGSENDYLIPTVLKWIEEQPWVGRDSDALRPFKWRLIDGSLNQATVRDAIVYLALVLRHVVSWMIQNHGNYYRPEHLVWELRVGLPAESAEDSNLGRTYNVLLCEAVRLASEDTTINHEVAEAAATRALHSLRSGNDIPVDALFERTGVLLPKTPTPELAANIEGFYRSQQWDEEQPYGLLVDVGAATIDVAFCSLLSVHETNRFNVFQQSVEPLGVFRLHDHRVEWLVSELGKISSIDRQNLDQLLGEFCSIEFDHPIPASVDQYLKGVEVENGDPDKPFRDKLLEVVLYENLLPGLRKFFSRIPGGTAVPVYVSGGGSRHFVFQRLLDGISRSPNASWTLDVQRLAVPEFVKAATLADDQRDRLAVAYGLCADEEWVVNYPHSIADFVVEKNVNGVGFISKDMV